MAILNTEKEKTMRPLAGNVSYDIHRIFDFSTAGMITPNRVIFGCGAIEQIGKEAARMDHRQIGTN